MARPKKVTQTETADNTVENQEVNASNEFDTDIVQEVLKDETTERVVTKQVMREVPTNEQRAAVQGLLQKKEVNAVNHAGNLQTVVFKGQRRTWSKQTLEVMLRSFPNQVSLETGELVQLNANGGCCK